MQNYLTVLKDYEIEFKSSKQALSWLRRQKVRCIKIGESYFINRPEFEASFENYLEKQLQLKKKQSQTAKKNFKLGKKYSEPVSYFPVNSKENEES